MFVQLWKGTKNEVHVRFCSMGLTDELKHKKVKGAEVLDTLVIA
ncbi:hypothetical protein [Treponema parvum]|nr:hypothetical protein [Treponema parvum]